MNQIIYSWTCHKETPCVAILRRQKCHFFFLSFTKLENIRAEQVLPRGTKVLGRRREGGKRV
jgi:hypothetical protein